MDENETFLVVSLGFPVAAVPTNLYAKPCKLLSCENKHCHANIQHYALSFNDRSMRYSTSNYFCDRSRIPKEGRKWKRYELFQKVWCLKWWISLWKLDITSLEPVNTFKMVSCLNYLSMLSRVLLFPIIIEYLFIDCLSESYYCRETMWHSGRQ